MVQIVEMKTANVLKQRLDRQLCAEWRTTILCMNTYNLGIRRLRINERSAIHLVIAVKDK